MMESTRRGNGPAYRGRFFSGIGLVEVLLALAILTAGFFPIYSLLRENRGEAVDAAVFLSLQGELDARLADSGRFERTVPAGIERTQITTARGARTLTLRFIRIDPFVSFAPAEVAK